MQQQEREKIQVEELHKEIDLIQNCINRMSNNSFLLKGWLITIIAAVVTLSQADLDSVVFFVLVFSTLIFWWMDAFFLRAEKEYRKMYEWMLLKRKENSRELQYDLNPKRFVQFTVSGGRHSVLERPLSDENSRPFLVKTPAIIGY